MDSIAYIIQAIHNMHIDYKLDTNGLANPNTYIYVIGKEVFNL